MSPEHPHVDAAVAERDRLRYALLTPLTTITGRTQLLQRITEHTPGLTDLERTVLLDGLAATLVAVQQLGQRLEALIDGEAVSGSPALPIPTTPAPPTRS